MELFFAEGETLGNLHVMLWSIDKKRNLSFVNIVTSDETWVLHYEPQSK